MAISRRLSKSQASRASSSLLNLALPFEQIVHFLVGHGFGELLVDLFVFPEQIDGFLNPLLDDLADVAGLVQEGFLLQETHGVSGREDGLAHKFFIDPGQDAQQGAFPGPVQTDDADFGPVEIRKGDILENRLFVVILADPHHGVDNLIDVWAHNLYPKIVSVSENA